MRIFLLTSKLDFETGGGSNSDLDLKARTLMERGNEVTVVTAFSGSNKIASRPPYHLIEERMPARGLIGIQLGALSLFRKYAREADVYHFDGQNFLYGAGLYRLLGGTVPVVSFFNRELVSWQSGTKRLRFVLEKYLGAPLANAIDLHMFTSPAYRRLYEAWGLRMRYEPLIVGDLFDAASIMKEHAVMTAVVPERAHHVPPFTLLYSGRLVPMRGVDLLIKALAELSDRDGYRLVIAGAGPEDKALKELAERLGVAKQIEFKGWMDREAIYKLLALADAFVIPKGNGATSVALLEAMAFGLPSIVPHDDALSWVAGPGALTFEEDDHRGLAKQIEKLARERELRQTLMKNAFARLAELDYKDTVKRIEAAMRELVSS